MSARRAPDDLDPVHVPEPAPAKAVQGRYGLPQGSADPQAYRLGTC